MESRLKTPVDYLVFYRTHQVMGVEFMSFLFSANPKKESNIVAEEKSGESSAVGGFPTPDT
jgi:hypothetical protein